VIQRTVTQGTGRGFGIALALAIAWVIVALVLDENAAEASAKAPAHAHVVVGRGAAGVKLGQKARVVDRGGKQLVKGRRLSGWGKVKFCYEGSTCNWSVKGGGGVAIEIANDRATEIHIQAKGWRTARGIHRGSTARAVRHRYPNSQLRTVCWGPYGVVGTGLVLRRGGAVTLFDLNRSGKRVFAIRLLQQVGSVCG
jgi:hypothetical protein